MRFRIFHYVLIFSGVATLAHADGPHLGIKIACRDYQNAWLSGQKGPLYGQCGPALAAAWERLPDDVFRELMRDPNTQLLSVSKQRRGHSAVVSVSGAQGNFQVLLNGKGFKWQVTDILTPDADRQLVSLTDVLNIASVSSEFGQGFDSPKFELFPGRVSEPLLSRLQSSNDVIGKEGGAFIGQLQMNRAAAQVRVKGNTATLLVPVGANDSNQYIQLSLKQEQGWVVDDVSCKVPTLEMASFRDALPMIVQANNLKLFLENPKSRNPRDFVAAGTLREELEAIRTTGTAVPKEDIGPHRLVTFSDDCRQMTCHHDKMTIAIDFDPERTMIREVRIVNGVHASKMSDKLKTSRRYRATAKTVTKLTENWLAGIFSKH